MTESKPETKPETRPDTRPEASHAAHRRLRRLTSFAAAALVALLAVELTLIAHRESPSWDEPDHVYAGYMQWLHRDFGLNPEHPPLVKFLAALPLLPQHLQLPAPGNRDFKIEANVQGSEFFALNGPQRVVFPARMAAALLTLVLALLVYVGARGLFGWQAGLTALMILVLEPTILAHGSKVTTDIALTAMLLMTVLAYFRWNRAPTAWRLAEVGIGCGLALAAKHSGLFVFPVLLLLGVVEVLMWVPAQQKGPKSGGRGAVALQQLRGIAVAGVLALGILWAFYGFRYAMRPAGLEARPTLAVYAHDLPAADASAIAAMARWHLLPESYLMGLADVRLVERQMPSFLLGHNYPHGVWWYFPVALSIKLTLGMLGLLALLAIALALGRPRHLVREVLYMAVPALAYLALAMRSGLNIGVRHVLPVFPFLILLVSGAAWALIRRDRRWQWPVGALLLAHAVSSLAAYPDYLAYSNVLWGGPRNTYKYLSDSNVDWGQQLISVKRFLDRESPEPCWFVYFMDPIVRPAQYGIPCRPMPTMDTAWLGMPTDVPTHVTGRVLVSAGDWSGGEWPDARLNPYLGFHSLRPAAIIDGGVLVYEGDFDMRPVAALSHAQRAQILLDENSVPLALEEARRAATDAPGDVRTELVLGKALYRAGSQAEAVRAWLRAVHNCGELNPVTAEQYLEELRGLIAKAQP